MPHLIIYSLFIQAILKKEVNPIKWDIIQTAVTPTGEAMET
jgi:hypothetical protein